MYEQLFSKLLVSLTEPVQLILLTACCYLVWEKNKLHNVMEKQYDAQQEAGIALNKLVMMVESIFRDSKGGK
jgi:hypothetical protein